MKGIVCLLLFVLVLGFAPAAQAFEQTGEPIEIDKESATAAADEELVAAIKHMAAMKHALVGKDGRGGIDNRTLIISGDLEIVKRYSDTIDTNIRGLFENDKRADVLVREVYDGLRVQGMKNATSMTEKIIFTIILSTILIILTVWRRTRSR